MARPLRAGIDCVKNCPNLNGCLVQDVEIVLDQFEQPTGWVVLSDEYGRESAYLPDRGENNNSYLNDVQNCSGTDRSGKLIVRKTCTTLEVE